MIPFFQIFTNWKWVGGCFTKHPSIKKNWLPLGFQDGIHFFEKTRPKTSFFVGKLVFFYVAQLPSFHGPSLALTFSPLLSARYLEDHPMTCKWLITMVIVTPLGLDWTPSKWLNYIGDDPITILTSHYKPILQVASS